MNENFYKSYDELPLMLSVQEIARYLEYQRQVHMNW